ncbi:hypothetical protein ONZ51_g6148 [Trametes cubensis]|uniref:Uncharacterized protein n=1 Tax=Trametes cubensis TaxID=1111947 RepID=A0AAD7TSL6_9APHY|nr:hypothetical protein ONZ51_g6148 [Trametes cubensis]
MVTLTKQQGPHSQGPEARLSSVRQTGLWTIPPSYANTLTFGPATTFKGAAAFPPPPVAPPASPLIVPPPLKRACLPWSSAGGRDGTHNCLPALQQAQAAMRSSKQRFAVRPVCREQPPMRESQQQYTTCGSCSCFNAPLLVRAVSPQEGDVREAGTREELLRIALMLTSLTSVPSNRPRYALSLRPTSCAASTLLPATTGASPASAPTSPPTSAPTSAPTSPGGPAVAPAAQASWSNGPDSWEAGPSSRGGVQPVSPNGGPPANDGPARPDLSCDTTSTAVNPGSSPAASSRANSPRSDYWEVVLAPSPENQSYPEWSP